MVFFREVTHVHALRLAGLRLGGNRSRTADRSGRIPDRRCRILATLALPDGSILTESAAILIHLGLEFPGTGLLPAATVDQAQAIRGLVYIAANCYAAIGIIDYPERLCADADEALRERIRNGTTQRLHQLWDVFADTFPARPFLAGERIGALDLLAAVVSRWSGARRHLAQSRPQFAALLQRIEREPRIAPVFERHFRSLDNTPPPESTRDELAPPPEDPLP